MLVNVTCFLRLKDQNWKFLIFFLGINDIYGPLCAPRCGPAGEGGGGDAWQRVQLRDMTLKEQADSGNRRSARIHLRTGGMIKLELF